MNRKVSQLASAVSATANDLLLLVQNTISKSLTIEKLFGEVSVPVDMRSTLSFGGIPSEVTTGPVPLDGVIVHINLSAAQTLTLGAGTQGQMLYLVTVSGTGTATITDNLLGSPIVFTDVGQCVLLIYSGGRWTRAVGTAG